LNGQRASIPYGRLASAPDQSSRMCDAYAAPQISTIRQRILPVTHPVTAIARIVTAANAPTLCVMVRWAGRYWRSRSAAMPRNAPVAVRAVGEGQFPRVAGGWRGSRAQTVAIPASAWPIG